MFHNECKYQLRVKKWTVEKYEKKIFKPKII